MFGNIGKAMKLIGELKTRLPEMQKKLDEGEFTASAGGGVVSATVTGKMRIVEIKLDKDLLVDVETDVLEDLIKAAVNAAAVKSQEHMKEAMRQLTGGMNIPGLDQLGKLLG